MTTTTANNKPSDIILKFLEEIVELWNNGRYQKVTEQCVALLKRKKTIENLNLTVPLQRILLQAYIHQDRYDKVSEWDSSTTAATTTREGCKDLVLYARYRTEDYESVSKLQRLLDKDPNEIIKEFENLVESNLRVDFNTKNSFGASWI